MTPTASDTLATLYAQHAELRERMDRCDELLVAVETHRADPSALDREVRRLRAAFEIHNCFEELLLRPLLERIDSHATVRTERMIEDHVNEHRTMYQQLETTDPAVLRDVLETLRAHLESEERYLLSPRVLHDEPHVR